MTVEPSFEAELTELERLRSADVPARLSRGRELEYRAVLAGDEHAAMRARLVVADMLHRVGDVAGGARLAVAVQTWAGGRGDRSLAGRSHLVLSSIFENIGDPASSLDHAVRAFEVLDDRTATREHGNHLLRLADALAFDGSADQSRRRYREAAEIFTAIDDRERLLIVLNNLAVLESELGEPQAAAAAADRLERELDDGELNSDFAETIARARLVGGDIAGATRAALAGMTLLAEQGDTKAIAPAELALTYAEILLADGDTDSAAIELARCIAICEARHLAGVMTQAMNVQAQIFAARGDFERAYLTHREFHTASVRLRSQQHDAAAQAREALFETDEARREAERFRMQARTDPLTDLLNRRHVDEVLPGWLATTGAPVTVAIIDLDHFKLVNDEFSHEVGDDVLRRIARLLTGAGGDASTGFAARLGGEEFIVVDRWRDQREAVAVIEEFRRTVETHDWAALADGLHVTISAGLATARADDTQRTLLSRADRALYEAKESGRNRVVLAP